MRIMEKKLCAYCGTEFAAQRSTAKYCCDRHRNYDRRRRIQEQAAENERALVESRPAIDLRAREVSDEEVTSFVADIQAAASALIDASFYANPRLRLLCGRIGRRVTQILAEEGVLHG